MHQALILIARAIAFAHDHWRRTVGRRLSLSGHVAVLEESLSRLEAENTLLRARLVRVPARRRPRYRRHERLEILWHAARYRLSVTDTACAFAITRQTVIHWRRALADKSPSLLPRPGRLPDLVREIARRLKAEWPRWGTRRIAGQLARLGVKASRSSVQRLLQRPRAPEPDDRLLPVGVPGLLARRPNHIWMIDFTRLGGVVRPAFVGAVIDAFSRRVLAIGFVRREPDGRFATRLLRRAIARHGAPTWLVSDRDRALRNKRVNGLLQSRGIRRRYGAVGRKGSISVIERFWRSLKQEYVNGLFLYRSRTAIEKRLRRYARWFNRERPHQGLRQRTPESVYRGRADRAVRDVAGAVLHVRFLDGDRRLPILRLADAA
ncbi:MAG: DDE-type integrase/transposase/recombinase [Planctomycetota bacterium]|jgi:putative transposase